MTFSYFAGSTARDDVRLLVGDVDQFASGEVRLEDEDIDRLLILFAGTASPGVGGIRRVAAEAADILAAKFARKAEGSTGPRSISASSRSAELRATARQLRQGAGTFAVPTAGGISVAEKDTAEDDTDRVAPAFRKGMLDHPETSDAATSDAS